MTRKDDFDLLAQAFESLKDVPPPSPVRREAGRRVVIARAEQWQIARANRSNGAAPHLAGPSIWKATDRFTDNLRRFRMVAVIVAVILAIGAAGGVFFAADASSPGDLLYPLDQAAERVRLTLARDDDATARLQIKFANERLREIEQGPDDDARRQQALDAFDQAIASVEALLALEGLSPESRAAIEAQLAALREARAALAGDAPAQLPAPGVSGEREIFGTLQAISADRVTVDGVTYLLAPNAQIKDALSPGDVVKVHLTVLADGRLLVREIELARDRRGGDDDRDDDRNRGNEIEIFGTLQAISGSSVTIDGVTYPFAQNAEIKDTLSPGDVVKVHLTVLADGTRVVREIELARDRDRSGRSGGDDRDDDDDDDDRSGRSGSDDRDDDRDDDDRDDDDDDDDDD
jgi:hypothetical protein